MLAVMLAHASPHSPRLATVPRRHGSGVRLRTLPGQSRSLWWAPAHITHHTLCLSLFHFKSIRTLHHLYIIFHHFTGVPIVLDLDLCPSSTCFFPSGPSVSFWKFLRQFGCVIASKVHLDPCFGARNSLVWCHDERSRCCANSLGNGMKRLKPSQSGPTLANLCGRISDAVMGMPVAMEIP